MSRWCLVFSLYICTVLPINGFAQKGSAATAQLQQKILQLVNDHRQQIGLLPLTDIAVADREAAGHSARMASKKVAFGHDGFDERSDRVMNKLKNADAAAENVAYGPANAERIVDMWLHSPGHKKNIEGDFNLTGIGMACDKNGQWYFTQLFFRAGR
ncbi:MAG: CAP domain-containing protein [Chitinophagia bacterium]|nr:CAP domain-containing protein [Chitinophagia bacterium]